MAKKVGVIRPDDVWPIAAFRDRIGVGPSTMAELIKDGLEVVEIRRKRYVIGQSWLDHAKRAAVNGNGKS